MPRILEISGDVMLLAKELHDRMQIGYEFPNLNDPLFCVKKLIMDGTEPVAAGALKLTTEAFVWVDPNGSDYTKCNNILALMELCHERARALNIQDVTAWIPPDVEGKFGSMLSKTGWQRSPWASWSMRVK